MSPREQFIGPGMAWKAQAYLLNEDFEQAAEWAARALRDPVTQIWGNVSQVSALGHLGRTDEAEIAIKEMLRRRPGMSVKKVDAMINIVEPKFRELLLSGLVKAGMEDDR